MSVTVERSGARSVDLRKVLKSRRAVEQLNQTCEIQRRTEMNDAGRLGLDEALRRRESLCKQINEIGSTPITIGMNDGDIAMRRMEIDGARRELRRLEDALYVLKGYANEPDSS